MKVISIKYIIVILLLFMSWKQTSGNPVLELLEKTYVPTAKYPAESYRIFDRNFETTWKSALHVIGTRRGTILTHDKEGRLITYFENSGMTEWRKSGFTWVYVRDTLLYLTLYFQNSESEKQTILYISIWNNGNPSVTGLERNLYEQISRDIDERN